MEDFFSCDYFALFGLPRTGSLSADVLRTKYESLQSKAHPDRFAGGGEASRRAALQMASRINDAYSTLSDPLRRAAYLLSLNGVVAFAEDNTAMPPEFLMQQIEWREELESADVKRRAAVVEEIKTARDEAVSETDSFLAKAEWESAADAVRRWKYLQKMLTDFSAS